MNRSPRRHRPLVALGAVALLAACSTTDEASEPTTAVTEPAAVTVAPTDAPAPTPTDAPATPAPTDAPTTPAVTEPIVNGPGVTDDTVKIGIVDFRDATAQELGGLITPEQGDRTAQANALAEWINASGGLGGRNMELVFRKYDTSTDSPQTAEALCNGFTQDDQVFAVVLFTQYQTQTRGCYADADTLMIDQTLAPFTKSVMASHEPYLWTPELPNYETVLSGQLDSLIESGWLTAETKLGIMLKGDPMAEEALELGYLPALTELGVEPVIANFDATDFTGASILAAIATMQGEGVTNVLFVGNPDSAAQFSAFAPATGFFPAFTLTTFDLPGFFTDNGAFFPPGSLDPITGMGFLPAADVRTADFPSNDGETACLEPLTAAGITFKGRAEARSAMLICDAFTLLKAGADGVSGSLTAATWAEAAKASGWTSAMSIGTDISRGGAPVTTFRNIVFSPTDQAFVYDGDPIEFP